MENRNILIAGAGIAGPTLAYWLGVAGFTPTLVERAPALRSGGYVIDFWGLGYDIAERMGLIGEIERVGYHVKEFRVVDDRGARIAGFGTKVFEELTGERYVTLGRSDLARLIFEKARPKTDVIFGDEIAGLEDNGNGVDVAFRHGASRRFDLVIGADGLHSDVRRLAFGPQSTFETRLGYAVAALEVTGYRPRDEDVYLMYGRPGHMVGRFTQHENRALFLFVLATGDVPQTLDAQKTLLRQTFGDAKWEAPRILDELDRATDLYFDSVSQIRMEHWTRGRIALTGDAAFCVSLLAGQGSALAMIAAYVLAGELAKAGGRHDVAFRNYETILRSYLESKQNGAERFAGAFAPRTRFGLWFRNMVVRALAIPGLARATFGRDIIDSLDLPDYRWPSLSQSKV